MQNNEDFLHFYSCKFLKHFVIKKLDYSNRRVLFNAFHRVNYVFLLHCCMQIPFNQFMMQKKEIAQKCRLENLMI